MKNLTIIALLLSSLSSFAVDEICYGKDTRISTDINNIGRLNITDRESGEQRVCTISLIGSSCAVTAGHCLKYKRALYTAEFNVPLSSHRGEARAARSSDRYTVSNRGTVHVYKKGITDWGVIKLKKNRRTKKYPGDVYGFYKTNFIRPAINDTIDVIGYGVNSNRRQSQNLSFTQRSANGMVLSELASPGINKMFFHDADTTQGSSGGAVINKANEIIGVHTTGGCVSDNNKNAGVLFSDDPDFKKAILSCLSN